MAEVRSVAVDDPADATPTISGTPNNPDVSKVTASYDSAGSITMTIDFYNAYTALDYSQNYAFWSNFSFGGPYQADDPGTSCSAVISGQHHVYATSTVFFDRATVSGFDGYLSFTRTASPDNKSITLTASSPSLANRDIRCMTYTLKARRRSTASNINSDYDSGCDCWYVGSLLDVTGESANQYSIEGTIWFPGMKPQAPLPVTVPTTTPPSSTSSAPQSGESAPLPKLTTKDAKMYAAKAIGRRFGKKSVKRSATCRPVDKTSSRCKVAWRTGTYTYRGTARIYYSLEKGKVFWNYAFDVTRTDAKGRKQRIVVK